MSILYSCTLRADGAAAMMMRLLLLLGLAGRSTPNDTPRKRTQHVQWLTFYDLEPKEQHGVLNLAYDGGRNSGPASTTQCIDSTVGNSSLLIRAFEEYKMPGMLDVQCLGGGLYVTNTSFECPACPTCPVCPVGSKLSLHPEWQGLLSKALSSAMPYLEKGAIRGVSLGDEPCCGGLPVAALGAVAGFVKNMIRHTGAFVYVNECARTFMGLYNNGTDGMYPGMITKANMPASIDIISADQYSPTVPQYEANMARRLYEGQAEFRGGGVYSALAPHQRVMVIPGLFADATKPRNASEALMLACLEGFWAWAQNDSRVSSCPCACQSEHADRHPSSIVPLFYRTISTKI
jgi:hypothetical protein